MNNEKFNEQVIQVIEKNIDYLSINKSEISKDIVELGEVGLEPGELNIYPEMKKYKFGKTVGVNTEEGFYVITMETIVKARKVDI